MRSPSFLLLLGFALGCAKTEDAPTPTPTPVATDAPTTPPRPAATSARCGFAVKLPFRRAPAPTPPGMLDQIATENRARKVAVTASCADLKRITSTDDLFDVTSRGMLTHLRATETARSNFEHQGRRGIEIDAHVPADKPIEGMGWSGALDVRMRMVRSGLRLYQLVVLQSADNDDRDAVATAFFDSFELSANAPAPTPAPDWARHTVGAFSVEAPGEPVPGDPPTPESSHDLRFVHDDGPTGYAIRIWPKALTSPGQPADVRLEAFLTLAYVTEHSQLSAKEHGKQGQWPTLDVDFRHNLPMPDSIAADNPEARQVAAEFIKEKKPGDRLRLVMVEDTVVELRVKLDRPAGDIDRFVGSLQRATP